MTPLYASRRRRNAIAMGLSFGATALGLGWLVVILAVLLWEGLSGLSVAVFTEMTPPPGSDGGLLAKPNPTDAVFLSPGERADVVVDFSRYAVGTQLVLENTLLNGGPAEGLSPGMPPFRGHLNEGQIRDIVAHLRSLADPPFRPGDPTRRSLYLLRSFCEAFAFLPAIFSSTL